MSENAREFELAVQPSLDEEVFLRLQRCVLDSMTEGVSVSDESGFILYTNPAEDTMFGYSRGELVGQHLTLQIAYPPEESKKRVAAVIEHVRAHGVWNGEWHNRRKDGTAFYTQARISAAELNGRHYWVSVKHDITARKEADCIMAVLEQELMLLVEASSTLLRSPQPSEVTRSILDLAQRFVSADAYAVWRRKPDSDTWFLDLSVGLSKEFIDASSSTPRRVASELLYHPMKFEDVEVDPRLQARRAILASENIRSMAAFPLVMHGVPCGTVTYYWRTPHVMAPAEERISMALANLAAAALSTADLYEQQEQSREVAVRAEQRAMFLVKAGALLSSSLGYETTLANVAKLAVPMLADWCGVDILDETGSIQRVATYHQDLDKLRFAQEMSRKYPPGPTDAAQVALRTGKSILLAEVPDEMLVAHAQSQEHLEMVRHLGLRSAIVAPMLVGEVALGVIILVQAESGRRYNEADLAVAEELARRSGVAIAHARLYRDVSESNTELRRLNDDLNQFAYSASHDLQEPLRMVAIYSQMFERRFKGQLDEHADEFIHYVVNGAQRMEWLIRDLLAYTQAANRNQSAPLGQVDANTILDQVLQNLKGSIKERDAEVERGMLPMVQIEAVHLLQLLQNLLGNAIKYSRRDTRPCIRIGCDIQGDLYRFSVADNGIGIPSSATSQIFGVFKRLHRNNEYSGTGIGLAICQRIVERYHGRIWVESVEGEGSTFYFTVPMNATHSAIK